MHCPTPVIGIGQIGCGMIGQAHAYAVRLLAEDGAVRPVVAADLSDDAARRRPAHLPVRTDQP